MVDRGKIGDGNSKDSKVSKCKIASVSPPGLVIVDLNVFCSLIVIMKRSYEKRANFTLFKKCGKEVCKVCVM